MQWPGRTFPMIDLLYAGRRFPADHLLIGQGSDADIRIPNASAFEDERIALVCQVENRPCLLVLGPAEPVSVSGTAVPSFCFLKEGDVVQVGAEEIRCVRSESADRVKLLQRFRVLAAVLFLLALVVLGAWGLASFLRGVAPGDEKSLAASVYNIRVGYVLLQASDGAGGYRTLDSLLADSHVGTGFLTTDGRFVTARHVAEPWMNPADTLFPEWAALVENTNRAAEKEVLRMITRLKAVNVEGKELTFSTDEARIDRSRDRVFNAGTRTEPRWKRSISIVFNDFSCALGDCAWFPVAEKGQVRLADAARIRRLQAGEPLLFVGSQRVHDSQDRVVLSPTEGRLKAGLDNGCLFHSSRFDPGDSGGPVLARIRGRVLAVGIISRKDADRKETSGWSVPVTELYADGKE